MSFNNTHPELKENEKFCINEVENSDSMFSFDSIPHKTKRLGNIAYDDKGNVIPNARPIFISKEEFNTFLNFDKIPGKWFLVFEDFDSMENEIGSARVTTKKELSSEERTPALFEARDMYFEYYNKNQQKGWDKVDYPHSPRVILEIPLK